MKRMEARRAGKRPSAEWFLEDVNNWQTFVRLGSRTLIDYCREKRIRYFPARVRANEQRAARAYVRARKHLAANLNKPSVVHTDAITECWRQLRGCKDQVLRFMDQTEAFRVRLP